MAEEDIRHVAGKWDLDAWQTRMGYSDSAAVRALELGSRNTWAKYKAEGCPAYIALACVALEHRMSIDGRQVTFTIDRTPDGKRAMVSGIGDRPLELVEWNINVHHEPVVDQAAEDKAMDGFRRLKEGPLIEFTVTGTAKARR